MKIADYYYQREVFFNEVNELYEKFEKLLSVDSE